MEIYNIATVRNTIQEDNRVSKVLLKPNRKILKVNNTFFVD